MNPSRDLCNRALFDVIDGDRIAARAIQTIGNPARDTLLSDAAQVLTGDLITLLYTLGP